MNQHVFSTITIFIFTLIISLLRIFAFKSYGHSPEIVRISSITVLGLASLALSKSIKMKRGLILLRSCFQLVLIICEIESIRINIEKGESGALGIFFLGLYFQLGSLLNLSWLFGFLIKCLAMIYYGIRVCSDTKDRTEFCLQALIFLVVLFSKHYYRWKQKKQNQILSQESRRSFLKEFIKQNIPGAIVILGLKENSQIGLELTNSASEDLLKSSDSSEIVDKLLCFSFKSTVNSNSKNAGLSHSKKEKFDLKGLINESLKTPKFNQYTATFRGKKKMLREGSVLSNTFSPMKRSRGKQSQDALSQPGNVAMEQEPHGDPGSAKKHFEDNNKEISNIHLNISSLNNHLLYQTKQIGKRFFSIKTCRVPWEGRTAVLFIIDELTENVCELDKKADKKSSEEIGRLLAAVSHKLYTPLNGIMNSLDNIKSQIKEGDKGLSRHIKFCSRSVHLLNYSIRNIVDLSKKEITRFDFDLATYQLGPILDDVLYLIRYLAKVKQIALDANYEEYRDLKVYCDAESLKRILINLIDNAIKFTNPGGRVKITVLLKVQGDEEDRISLQDGIEQIPLKEQEQFAHFIIQDNGCGIPRDRHRHLFKFSFKDNTEFPVSEGVCTGLPQSQKLLMSMLKKEYYSSGLLRVTSFPMVSGTQVSFLLPIEKLVVNDPRLSTSHLISLPRSSICKSSTLLASKSSTDLSHRKKSFIKSTESTANVKVRVLIVDDDKSNQLVLQNYLSKFGVKSLQTADNGQEAIDKVVQAASQQEPFTLVLMDLNMPIKNGYQASREITLLQAKGEIPETTIVAVTANVASNDWPTCKEVGMKAFLTKPVNKRLFRETLETLLGEKLINS